MCDEDGRRENTQENITQKQRENEQEQDPKPDGQTKLEKDIEIKGENWEEIEENGKWEDRDGWRFLCNS